MLSFLRTNARWIAGGFLLTFFSSFGQTFFIGLSGEELRAKFDLTDGPSWAASSTSCRAGGWCCSSSHALQWPAC